MLATWSVEADMRDWWAEALCNSGTGILAELFFSEQLDDIARAKAICTECPAREPCLQGAIARHEPWGVWGGELIVKGKVLARKRKRGRPSKTSLSEELSARSA